ncbi:uncharacterized protein [Glycine max]|uniref:Uncharacterized protein n=2 Tax=Glycine subgen. Soja TaxID=1462606 RepID=A0A0R0GD22_SOYBN|nr:uncharacterized protein LOC100818832 isoform X2 [Glycine max]
MLLAAYPWTTATHLGLKTDAVFSASENRHLKKRIKRLKDMVEPDKNCETRVEDVAWLCSLSESEIDMLISLKLLIIQRAKMMGCKELASKFNLKMIRAIALVLMGHLKEEIKDSSLIPNMVKSTSFLDACNLLKCSNEVDANIDELSTSLGADIETFLRSPPTSKQKKQKVGSRE